MIGLNKVLALVCKWLLISALFAAPIAIAQHQLDHLDHIQTAEQCDLCAHSKSFDNDKPTPQQIKPAKLVKASFKPNLINIQLSQRTENNFLSRAPPLS